MWQHGYGVALVEPSRHCQPHLAQLENPLDVSLCQMRDINLMTAGKAEFGANSAEEEHQARQITALLNNLANALIQKNATIDNLVASNARLAQALQEMQAEMVRMFPAGQAHASPYQPLMWLPTPPEAVAPPLASLASPLEKMSPSLSHWGSVKPAWDKQDYCWSHGHKVKVGHTSATCSSQRAGNQTRAGRANTMGRSIYNVGYPFRYHVPPPAPT
jgi:hypothetical protein